MDSSGGLTVDRFLRHSTGTTKRERNPHTLEPLLQKQRRKRKGKKKGRSRAKNEREEEKGEGSENLKRTNRKSNNFLDLPQRAGLLGCSRAESPAWKGWRTQLAGQPRLLVRHEISLVLGSLKFGKNHSDGLEWLSEGQRRENPSEATSKDRRDKEDV